MIIKPKPPPPPPRKHEAAITQEEPPTKNCSTEQRRQRSQILSKTILHELSHRLDNADDEKYCWPARYCEDLSTKDAIDNADSYARFAQEIFNIPL